MSDELSVEAQILAAQESRKAGENVPIEHPDADLSGFQLPGGDLVRANLENADLTGADLAGAQLARANLKGAILIGATLDGADLTDADMRGADLAGARIDDAVLAGARLEGACLQAVSGDPLSMVSARMDQATIENSDFTMRDIAQMVVRGVEVLENEVVPVSMAPAARSSLGPSGAPSILPVIGESQKGGAALGGLSLDPAPVPRGLELDPAQAGVAPESESPQAPPPPIDSDAPSSKRVLEPLDFDKPAGTSQSLRAVLNSIPPSVRFSEPAISQAAPSAPRILDSIIPSARAAEISARRELAEEEEQVPVSKRMFLQLSALIDDAQIEAAPPVSLRPNRQQAQQLAESGLGFPQQGEEYLGTTIAQELPPGTTSRCFRATGPEGEALIVRIFDPHCEGAALQLPAFQRGLRALNRLQGVQSPGLNVVQLIAVAADQTAYVTKEYEDQSLQEMLETSMSLEQGLKAIQSLGKTMAAIHEQGLMIRSWKPSNVLVDGMRLVVSEPDMVHLATLTKYRGDAGGYQAYAAPEELIGRGTRSPTADVFSLGKMLEFLLTGQEPLVPLGSPPLISQRENIPEVLVELVKRATAQEPADRYQSVGDMLADLKKFQEEGDRAVLVASIRPTTVSRLTIPPMTTNPEVPDVQEVIKERTARRAPKKKMVAWQRQAEIAAAMFGGIGGLLVVLLLIVSPRSVSQMQSLSPYLAIAIGFGAWALPVPDKRRVLYRVLTWATLAAFVWLVEPLQLAQLTWSSRLKSGDSFDKREAVESLSRLGEKDASGAQLDQAQFEESRLDSVDFTGASLKGANFKNGFLPEAEFDKADITDANFEGANLFGADLSSAIGLDRARCDRYTVLSAEFSCLKGYLSTEDQAPLQPGEDESEEDSANVEAQVAAEEAEKEERIRKARERAKQARELAPQ